MTFYITLLLGTNGQNVYTSPEVVFHSYCIYLLCIVENIVGHRGEERRGEVRRGGGGQTGES